MEFILPLYGYLVKFSWKKTIRIWGGIQMRVVHAMPFILNVCHVGIVLMPLYLSQCVLSQLPSKGEMHVSCYYLNVPCFLALLKVVVISI